MKRIALFAAAIALSGCVKTVQVDTSSLLVSDGVVAAGVGDTFFERQVMTGKRTVGDTSGSVFDGNAYRLELTVESASTQMLKLGYSEYMKQPSPYGYYISSPWLKKQAFSRTLEYNLTESKAISFRDYEFQIVDVRGGKVTYMRKK